MANLYYLVGPSGAGKDSVLLHLRRRLGGQSPVLVAHRYITRPAAAGGENHIEVSLPEFELMKERGLYALDWASHGLHYGIGVEINTWLSQGLNVLVNGSRGYLAEAASRYDNLRVVSLEVSPAVLRQRLERRGRESREEIEERIRRATAFTVDHPSTRVIRNDGELDETIGKIVALFSESPQPVTV